MHELRIGEAFGAHCRVDPLDPQRAEIALLNLAVAIGVLAGLFDRLAGYADGVLAAAAIALGLVEEPLVLGACVTPRLMRGMWKYSFSDFERDRRISRLGNRAKTKSRTHLSP